LAGLIGGLYVTGERINALKIRSGKKGWTLVGAASQPIESEDGEESLVPSIKPLAKGLKLAGCPTTVCLPKQKGILRDVQLPSTDPSELVQMARFETERHIPFHADRHCTGYHVMRSMGVEGSEVLLGAVDGPVVQRVLDGVVGAGIVPRGMTLSSIGLMNCMVHGRSDWLQDKTIAIIALGLEMTDLALVHDGRLIFSRSVTMDLFSVLQSWLGHYDDQGQAAVYDPGRLATAARMIDCMDLESNYSQGGPAARQEEARLMRGWLERVIQELNRTYDFARREKKCPPINALLLTGEGACLRNLNQYLHVNTSVEVETLNPVEKLPGADKQKMPWGGLEFAIPFGAAIGGDLKGGYQLDLTPARHYRDLARRRMIRGLGVSGTLLLITLVLGGGAWFRLNDIRNQELQAYRRISTKMASLVADLNEMQAKQEIIDEFLEDPNSGLVVLRNIAAAPMIPGRVNLTNIEFVKGDEVKIEGNAKAIPDINNFQQYLRGTGHFLIVDVPKQDPRSDVNRTTIYVFTIDCTLNTENQNGRRKDRS